MAGRREWTRETLAAGVRDGDRRALARAISLVEDGDPLAYGVVADLYPETGSAYSVGVTGPPGVGKSSLVSALIRHVRAGAGRASASSRSIPRARSRTARCSATGSGSRDHFLDPDVFIRSMGTRGHLGGLAEATLQALLVLDAAGKDIVFLETVGAGQSEVEVIGIADTVLLVLMPGSGDAVQALKAGIMEIPDVIAINKMDHPGAKTMLNEVRSILALGRSEGSGDWNPPIVLTEAMRGEHVPELWEKIEEHRAFLEQSGQLEERRRANLAARGLRGRLEPGGPPPRAGGRRRPRAAAPARRGAGTRARPADGGARDTREGLPDPRWRRRRHPGFLRSSARASGSTASRASLRSIRRRRSPGSPAAPSA